MDKYSFHSDFYCYQEEFLVCC